MREEHLLPAHGRMTCTACFGEQVNWGRTRAKSGDGWTLDNNPCAWGSRNPRFLLLGFSKGERQSRDILARRHNDIPYAGFRERLTGGLQQLGMLATDDRIDNHIRSDETDWAFGSVVRCALAKDGKKSGSIIPASVTSASFEAWQARCTDLYLSKLPSRLQLVIMLSNDDGYIEQCRQRITRLHPSTRKINDVAYGDGRVAWVHVVHFGGQAFNHMADWMSCAGNKAGRKGTLARQAVECALSANRNIDTRGSDATRA